MIFPAYAVVAVFLAAEIALFLFGIEQGLLGIFLFRHSRVSHITSGRASRTLGVIAGAAIGLSVAIIISPVFGAGLAVFIIGLGQLFCGIRIVITGIAGRSHAVVTQAGTMAA